MNEEITKEELISYLQNQLEENIKIKERIEKNQFQLNEMSNIEHIMKLEIMNDIIRDFLKNLT